MPQYRKLYTKVTQSFDFNDMPDDFTRCVWLLLPLGLDREGRGIFNGSWIKSRLMPLRTDVDSAQIMQAMDWFGQHGLIEVYEVDERSYFRVPTFKKYQGDTHKELESVLPPPPDQPRFGATPGSVGSDSRVNPEPLRRESRVTPEPVRSDSSASLESLQSKSCTDSDSDSDADAEVEADSDVRAKAVERPSAASSSSATACSNSDYLKIFRAVTGMPAIPFRLDGPFQSTVDGLIRDHTPEQIIALMRIHFDRWRASRSTKSGRLYGPTNPGWLEWVLAEPAIPPPELEPATKP